MKAWRMVITALSCLLLSGCLVTFKDPIPANEAAPMPLLGDWERKDEWGDQQYLSIARAGSNVYRAKAWGESAEAAEDSAEEYGFTVAHHGRRWYMSAGLPKRLGANFAIAGFELTAKNELVIYNLDVERILQEMDGGTLQGQPVETPEGEAVLITSSLDKVFSYLDDQANADVFVEVARYQRSVE
ncbi:hypothetical protein [Pseudomonas sp. Gutcm_11s]|uniref:hypothetical protein n=1 Tax=Pseudomonas sp. Gutcm_11s TaxID=3026088 RepID=UPI0023613689|nr:hypothetical protein [Pseudomonas sp. Gutcm_11s]MDD0841850.1 hypothetical protein [Pseudomonas sp. Gutcm_11s]